MYAHLNKAKNDELYVTLVADNNYVVFTSETYTNPANALHALDLALQFDGSRVIVDNDIPAPIRARVEVWQLFHAKEPDDEPDETEEPTDA
jgi:uncharacterized protein YegP (UPF0339 family)